jgi:pimeloyl-ACP methyl ester carboxylesterase
MAEPTNPDQTTVVLVHGAFADASSWNGVIARLQDKGAPVTAPANPLRGSPPTPPTSRRSSRRSTALCSPSDTRTAAR